MTRLFVGLFAILLIGSSNAQGGDSSGGVDLIGAVKTPPQRCYVCNSMRDPDCQPIDKSKYMTECKPEEKSCRKMYQKVGSLVIVDRKCSTLNQYSEQSNWMNSCTDRVGTKKIKIRTCYCDAKECNSGNSLAVCTHLITLIASLLVAGGLFQ